MKSKRVVSFLVMATMLCPAFAFAAEKEPVVVDETVAVAEDASNGDIVGSAEMDELYAPETAKDIKAEAKEETEEVKADAKEAIKNIKEDEKEALKEEAKI